MNNKTKKDIEEKMKKLCESEGFKATFHPTDNWGPDHVAAITDGVDLNNQAYAAANRRDFKTAIQKYKKALELKVKAYGENSLHCCISLSGLADAYLDIGDKSNAQNEAERMLRIAKSIDNSEQIRIAKEILSDIDKKFGKSEMKKKPNKDESQIKIDYGRDDKKGVFLVVTDKRLQNDEKAKKGIKEVTNLYTTDKNGTYLNLYTGESDKGTKVSKDTIEVYLRKYNISEDEIRKLLNSENCFVCKKDTTKFCQKCKTVYYCSRECQVNDWKIHKHYCPSLPMPPKVIGKDSVIGLLFSENATHPTFVHVPLEEYIEEICGKEYRHLITNNKTFLKDTPGFSYWEENPLKNKPLENTLIFAYRDNFLNDGSKVNECVKKVSSNMNQHQWRGPLLVTKKMGYMSQHKERYLDVELTDFPDIIDFFLYYGSELNKQLNGNKFNQLKDFNFNILNL
jgi:tetratricopeptide (TPR) repeat protein